MLLLSLICATVVSSCVAYFQPIKISLFPLSENEILEDPLFLTPLLKKGKYKKAQHLSKVTPDIGNTTSYSGFFTVNEECDSNLFFWFFPAQKGTWEEAPLVLWLQGGPGSTSMLGLFEELGPFESYKEGLRRREFSWNVENNLLFIDQPVGVGYSFTGRGCYPHNETAVAADLYQAVDQFHQLFPTFQNNRFFITGESYAGHYIPALGYAIHRNNPSAKVKINLVTMMIGDGWVDPTTQVDYGSYLYQLGFIDDNGKEVYKKNQDLFVSQVESKDWDNAITTCKSFTGSLFKQFVGNVSKFNFLPPPHSEKQNWKDFIQSVKLRKSLHVGKLPFQTGKKVSHSLRYDTVQSVKPWVEELLEIYPIVFYNGELDIICAYPMMVNFLRSLTWSGESQYINASRTKWCVENEASLINSPMMKWQLGPDYYKGTHNLYDVLVGAAGHMVPKDQSYWAYVLVNSVTSSSPDNPLQALTPC